MADKPIPAPTPPPAPKPPLEDRIRALEADRKAGKSVPELDAAYAAGTGDEVQEVAAWVDVNPEAHVFEAVSPVPKQ